MRRYKKILKERSITYSDLSTSEANSLNTAQKYLLNYAKLKGMQLKSAVLAIDDVLSIFDALVDKGMYSRNMSISIDNFIKNVVEKKL